MEFDTYARQPDERLSLLEGALLVARDAYPGLDLTATLRRIERLGEPLASARLHAASAAEQAEALAAHLAGREGLRGDVEDYRDPDNALLNRVLDRRRGLPITLSILWVEVGRRLGIGAHGVAFPGHFLVRIEGTRGEGPVLVDPFHGGEVLAREAAQALLARAAEGQRLTEELLQPAPTRVILLRLLANLRASYASRGELSRLLLVLDRMLALAPAAEVRRDRGMLHARLGAPEAARADLLAYVREAPQAGDVPEVRRVLDTLARSPRQWH